MRSKCARDATASVPLNRSEGFAWPVECSDDGFT